MANSKHTALTGIFSKSALLCVRDMLRDRPHMQPHGNIRLFSEVIVLLSMLRTTDGDEAIVNLED